MSAKILYQGVTQFAAKRVFSPFFIRRRRLAKTQWLDKKAISDLQLRLLQKLVKHCYDTVPYYRKLMDSRGIKVKDINRLESIKLFPVLTKQGVLKAGLSLVSKRYPKCSLRKAYTGGTTGTPMTIYRDLFSIGNEHAFVRRQWDWAGIGFGDRCAYLKGRVIRKPDSKIGPLHVYDPVMKELYLSTYHLSNENAEEYLKIMNRYKVKAIVGYPSSVYFLARRCLETGIVVRLKSALITSETLLEEQRAAISKAFNCKVFDFFGSAERVCYIHTCEQLSYHIIPEYGLVELIEMKDSFSNKLFKIVATGFWNKAMPFIRYDMGDLLTLSNESCPCGRTFPVVKRIYGREGDIIKTSTGRELGASIITHLVYVICGADNILESQIIQDAKDHITIEYVPAKSGSKADFSGFQGRLNKHIGEDLKVDLKSVQAVKRTSSGKIKPIICEI